MALGFKSTSPLACARTLVNRLKYGWLDARKRPHPLILDGLCLHVLSSFQRTEPSATLRPKPSRDEPFKFTTESRPLSTPIRRPVSFSRRRVCARSCRAIVQTRGGQPAVSVRCLLSCRGSRSGSSVGELRATGRRTGCRDHSLGLSTIEVPEPAVKMSAEV